MSLEKLQIRTAYVDDLLERGMDALNNVGDFTPFGVHPQLMLVGYIWDLVDLSDKVTDGLDLTYETVHMLPTTMTYVYPYLLREEEMLPARARLDMAKKLASYLMVLVCNMHGGEIHIQRPNARIQQKEKRIALWANALTMTVGTRQHVDLLPSCIQAFRAPKDSDDGFIFEPRMLIAKYQRATGIDLQKYGLQHVRNLLC